MRGLELQNARQLRRAELRRNPRIVGIEVPDCYALDEGELLQRADAGDAGALGISVKRRLILDALGSSAIRLDAIAAAWRIDTATLDAWKRIPLLDKSGAAAKIDALVLEELPETPEPGRHQEPPASYDARNDRRWARVD